MWCFANKCKYNKDDKCDFGNMDDVEVNEYGECQTFDENCEVKKDGIHSNVDER